jgi:hypothetical protein
LAGDEINPEVDDDTGDAGDGSEPGNQFRDIDAAWFGESNTSVEIYMKMAGSPPGLMDLVNNPDTTTFEYEIYFDVEGESFAVVAIIQYAAYIGEGTPIGGVYSTESTWDWELRGVNYALGTDIIQSETTIGGLSDSSFTESDVILKLDVSKEDIGIGEGAEGRGQLLTNTWAGIWNANDNPSDGQRDPTQQAFDYAHTYNSNPGRTYRLTGYGGIDYAIELSTDNGEKETFGGTPVEFVVKAHNNGTHAFEVKFFTSEPPVGWTVAFDRNTTTVPRDATQLIQVTITPPKDVANGTVQNFIIEGDIQEVEGGNSTVPVDPPLKLTVVALKASGESEDGAWWENLMDTIKDNILIVGGAIAIVIIALVILVILVKR